ncbi:DUF1972 domain-containing protein [Spirosoma sp. SC4-14]|uniref:DUF1972 domain-containing protein n=1 Tax=Spirosoma sp. SC4-14 TaxID=3128900 RepID=UPI0030D31EF9
MQIGIIGTRGIPNYYGGFEQCAEFLAVQLTHLGHEVTVYNSHYHPYREKIFQGVTIIHCYDPEKYLGLAGQFIYDFNCILDTRKRNFDLILQLGYTTNAIWGWLLPSRPVIVTNMDGIEWMRSKYPFLVQEFLKKAERWAVNSSDYLVSDSIGIQQHIEKVYNLSSTYIPYGSYVFTNPNSEILEDFSLMPYQYDMLIARLQSDNSIDEILEGVIKASKRTFLVVGNHLTKYGRYLTRKYAKYSNIKFLGAIYDLYTLDNLRYYSNIYFHGHRVGGTNPSLLEAMASSAFICAYDNIFNKSILGKDAFYFRTSEDIAQVISEYTKLQYHSFLENNRIKIENTYHWPLIVKQYEELFKEAIASNTHSIKKQTISI